MIISTPLACVSITYSVGSLLPLIMIPNSPEPRIQAAQLLVSCAQLGLPDYVAEAWHIYLVYLGMMLYVAAITDSPILVFENVRSISYLVICLPTKYVSWFNIWSNALGIIILSKSMSIVGRAHTHHQTMEVVLTILLPVKSEALNSGKAIFTQARA